jgi:hypothetical protein
LKNTAASSKSDKNGDNRQCLADGIATILGILRLFHCLFWYQKQQCKVADQCRYNRSRVLRFCTGRGTAAEDPAGGESSKALSPTNCSPRTFSVFFEKCCQFSLL